MTPTDLKGILLVRRENLAAQLVEKQKMVVLIEADLIKARREADTVNGALQGTELALADLEKLTTIPTK